MRLATTFCLITICISSIVGQIDSAQYYFDKGLKLKDLSNKKEAIISLESASRFNASDSLLAQVYHQLGNLHYGTGEYPRSVSYWQDAITYRSRFLSPNHIDIIIPYINIGNAENILGHTKQSREALINALERLNNMESSDVFRKANVYLALGRLEKTQLNLIIANNYLTQAYELYPQCDRDIGWRRANACTNLFDSYKLLEKPKEALLWAQRSLDEIVKNKDNPNEKIYRANAYSNRGIAYKLDQQFEKAKADYLKALELNLAIPKRLQYSGVVLNNLIALYTTMGDYVNAANVITQAKTIFRDSSQSQLLANTLIEEAKFKHKKGDYLAASRTFKKAQDALSISLSSQSVSELMRIAVNEGTIVDLITGKLKSITSLYKQTKDLSLLMETEVQIDELASTINDISIGMSDLQTKLEFAGFVNEFFDISISIKHSLYKETQDDRYARQAWHLMDVAKSRSILDGLRWNEASNNSPLLKSLYKERKTLQNQLIQLRTSDKIDQDTIMQLQAASGSLELQIDSVVSIDNIWMAERDKAKIKSLLPQSLIMQYHIAKDSIYSICKNQDELLFQIVGSTDEIINNLEDFIQTVRDPESSEDRVVKTAAEAYRLLMPQQYSKEIPKSIIIIPDGMIGRVPFEALIVKAGPTGFQNQDYLINYSNLSYASSFSVLSYQVRDKKRIDKAVGFAVGYQDFPIGDYNTLVHSTQELSLLNSFSSTNTFKDSSATKELFMDEAQDASLIHLSLHGIINAEKPSMSHLQFYPQDKQDDGKVYLKDIYHTDINPELIILSACSSGDGYLSEADGTISFAHAFSYSQAKTIVLNLWDSASLSSHDLLKGFYQGITNQQSTTEALRQSKIDYIKEVKAPELAHPFYWSTLVIYGDPLPLKLTNSFPLLLIVILAAIGLYFIFRMIRAASSV